MNYSGIDRHSNNSVVIVTDEQDRMVAEKRLPNDLKKIIEFLEPWREEPWREELVGVMVESTYNWYWLVDGLQESGFEVKLANTWAIKTYDGLKHIGAPTDARHLAHLLRLELLPTGSILPPEQRALRDLARKRMQRVRNRTSHLLAIQNTIVRQQGIAIGSNPIKRLTPERIGQMGLPSDVALAIESNWAVIVTLSAQIDRLEKRLQERMATRPEYDLLTSVPGIGRILATVIVLETGSIDRFTEVGHFASYARCVDSQRISNGKKKGEGNVKNGNKYLAWAFVEAAHFALRFCTEAKRFYERKKAKTNTAVATKALAHKLARACFHILKEGQPFDVRRCFA
jgi:transposase